MANCEASANSQAAMQRLKDELSDDEKNGNIGKIITYIPDLCQTGWSFREANQNLGKLSTLGWHLEKVGRMLDNMTRDQRRSERLPTVHCDCVFSKMAEFSFARCVFTVFLRVIFTGLES